MDEVTHHMVWWEKPATTESDHYLHQIARLSGAHGTLILTHPGKLYDNYLHEFFQLLRTHSSQE